VPDILVQQAGMTATLREALGNALNHLNQVSKGAIMATVAALLGSTATAVVGKGFPSGLFQANKDADATAARRRRICEDAMTRDLRPFKLWRSDIRRSL
jgi:hypothetical protein